MGSTCVGCADVVDSGVGGADCAGGAGAGAGAGGGAGGGAGAGGAVDGVGGGIFFEDTQHVFVGFPDIHFIHTSSLRKFGE